MNIISLSDYRTKQDPPLELDGLLSLTYPEAIEWAIPQISQHLMYGGHLPGETEAAWKAREDACRLRFIQLLTTWMDTHGLSVADLQAEIDTPTAPAAALPTAPRDLGRLAWTMRRLDPALLEEIEHDVLAELARQEALADILDHLVFEYDAETELLAGAA